MRKLKKQAQELIRETSRLEKAAGDALAGETRSLIDRRREALAAAVANGDADSIETAGEALEKVFEEHLTAFRKSAVREYIEALGIALALALFIRHFFIQAFEIPSGSMKPTLLVGDYLLVNKAVYGFTVPFTTKKFWIYRQPERGEIVVFLYPKRKGSKDPDKDFIKRVVGLSGDRVEVRGTNVWVNGKLYEDPHAHWNLEEKIPENGHMGFGPETVPEGHLFVMGDNRDNSSDSRVWGYVPLRNIKGKALIIYFSKGSGFDVRWSRFFSLLE